MRRTMVFIHAASGMAVTLPVTPKEYIWENGINIEKVTLDRLGDLNMAGHRTLYSGKIECLFPAHVYPFNEPGASTNPFMYVEQFERWSQGRTVVRFLVTGTPLNAAVLIESIQYGENDGTNNVTAVINIRQYQTPQTTVASNASVGTVLAARGTDTAATDARTYAVVRGDSLWSLCRKFYGDASLYDRLASANGIKNPSLIYVGQILTIPARSSLPAS